MKPSERICQILGSDEIRERFIVDAVCAIIQYLDEKESGGESGE